MASTGGNISDYFIKSEENSDSEVINCKDSEDLSATDRSNSDFEQRFYEALVKHDEQHQGK